MTCAECGLPTTTVLEGEQSEYPVCDTHATETASCDSCDRLLPIVEIRTVMAYGSEGDFCDSCRTPRWLAEVAS